MANAGLDGVRKQLRLSLSAKERKTLMHDRFLLLRRAHDLQPMEQVLVEAWTRDLPLLGEAYQAKGHFLYESSSPSVAERTYQDWKKSLSKEVEALFSPLTIAMHNWHDEIFAYY